MIFTPSPIEGMFLIDIERREDERGFFARTFCEAEMRAHGIEMRVTQCNLSWCRAQGTLRGLHYQAPPHEEAKLVRCTRGAIWDVIVDLRAGSKTYLKWFGEELTAENRRALYIPRGFAHGFQTLADDAEVFYQMSEFYHPECARGIRWDDPAIGIRWPLADPIVSERDRGLPLHA